MKNLLLILVMFCCMAVNAAKVALIPAAPELAPVADQALAAMSNDSGIEFLERAGIEAVLKERNLTAAGLTGSNLVDMGKTIHADLFAVITAKPGKSGAVVSGLIVYDARNGFRLVNAAVAEQDAVKEIVERLRQAQDIIKYPEKQILLSIVTVRDAGVPEKYKYQTAFITAEIDRQLSSIPGVVMLEREYLDSVNQERQITGQMFKLAPSARLLRLEFSPGSSPEIVNLILRTTNAADKELFRFSLDNGLADSKATATNTVTAMAEYLKVSPRQITVSASEEAARFFAEYQFFSRLGDYAAARRKLNAAIALEPKKLECRLAALALNRDEGYISNSPQKAIAAITKNLELCQEIEHDFPICRGLYSYQYFDWNLDNKRQFITRQDRQELAQLTNLYRPKFLEEITRQFYKFDLADGINSFEEWKMYNRYCLDMGRFNLYWDENQWCDFNYQTALKNLELSRIFFRKHPALPERDAAADWFNSMMMEYALFQSGASQGKPVPNPESKKVLENMLRNSGDYIAIAPSHPLASVRLCGLKLDLLRKTVLSNYNSTDFKKNMQKYCQQELAVAGSRIQGEPDNYFLIAFLGYNNPLLKAVADIRRENIVKMANPDTPDKQNVTPEFSMKDLFNMVKREATPEGKAGKALELATQLQPYIKLSFTDPEVHDFFMEIQRLVEQYGNNQNPVFGKLEKAMNSNVNIQLFSSLDSIKIAQPQNGEYKMDIKNAVCQNEHVYLLIQREQFLPYSKPPVRQACWNIGRIDMATGKINLISAWSPWKNISLKINTEMTLPSFYVSDNIAIAGADDSILLFLLGGGEIREIKDLPGQKVMAATALNGRIYAFTGHKDGNVARETILFSCKFDGNDRQIHISTSRDDKKGDMDRQKPFIVYTVIGDKAKDRLIFNCDSPNQSGTVKGLWEFRCISGTGKCLFDKKWRMMDSVMTKINDKVFFSFFHEDYCVYDLNTDQGEVFFSTTNNTARNYLKAKFSSGQGIFYHAPFFVRPDQIWFGGDCSIKLITLPDAGKSPLILMPYRNLLLNNLRLLFPHPDGKSAIAVDGKSIYKITPKETGGK
ncbi:MAG: hypothetical protein WCV67_12580 [Victivallaceae bacterium]|jgi:hypothetical protein